MKIPITKPYFGGEELQAVKEVLDSGWVAQGPKTHEFEEKFAAYTGVKHALAVTSCTTALHLALVAEGIGTGDDVIVPSFTFIATANAVEYTGAVPVFCDIDISTFNISIENIENVIKANYIEKNGKQVNKNTSNILRGIIAVHLFGLAADIIEINKIADIYGLTVIEDAACGLGAGINKKHVGTFGNTSCFSLHPRKAITCGEGGVITTDDTHIAEKIISLRNHGATVSDLQRHQGAGWLLPEYKQLGYNYRLTDIQGALINVQMDKLEYILQKRRFLAQRYDEYLGELSGLITPHIPARYVHGYQSYVCYIDYIGAGFDNSNIAGTFRNKLMEQLEDIGIATRQGTHAVHTLDYYKQKYNLYDDMFPQSYEADRLSMSLPLYVTMTEDEQDFVINKLKECWNVRHSRFS